MRIEGVEDLTTAGQGGFGTIYRGRQPAFDRDVAVKVLAGMVGADGRAAFEREARAMGRASAHPSVLAVYSSGFTETGQPYLVMPWADGGSLADRISGPSHPDQLDWVGPIADALDFAHTVGLLHRDVKPHNILFDAANRPMLADFGIAKVADATSQTATGQLSATIAYAPPELLDNQPASAAADIYSLAATAYHHIAGHPPFAADGPEFITLLSRIATQPADRQPLLDAGATPPVADAICAGLAKQPADRPATAAEYAAGIADAVGDSTIRFSPPPPKPAPGKPVATKGRRPILMGAAAVLVMVLVGIIAAVLVNRSGAPASSPSPDASDIAGTSAPAPTEPVRLADVVAADAIRSMPMSRTAGRATTTCAPGQNPTDVTMVDGGVATDGWTLELGVTTLLDIQTVYADVTGDGVEDAVTPARCTSAAGTVTDGVAVLEVDPDDVDQLTLTAELWADERPGGAGQLTGIDHTNDTVTIRLLATTDSSPSATTHQPWTRTLTADDGNLTVTPTTVVPPDLLPDWVDVGLCADIRTAITQIGIDAASAVAYIDRYWATALQDRPIYVYLDGPRIQLHLESSDAALPSTIAYLDPTRPTRLVQILDPQATLDFLPDDVPDLIAPDGCADAVDFDVPDDLTPGDTFEPTGRAITDAIAARNINDRTIAAEYASDQAIEFLYSQPAGTFTSPDCIPLQDGFIGDVVFWECVVVGHPNGGRYAAIISFAETATGAGPQYVEEIVPESQDGRYPGYNA